jgi:predicted transcriptional regulator
MNEPQYSEKIWEMRPILSAIGNTSKELFREIAIKWTKSLINLWDDLSLEPETMSKYLKKIWFSDAIVSTTTSKIGDKMFLKPENMSKYLKKLWFSDAIVDAAMRQAWFAKNEGEMLKEVI